MKFFVGLDVSLKETAICLVDADGIIISSPTRLTGTSRSVSQALIASGSEPSWPRRRWPIAVALHRAQGARLAGDMHRSAPPARTHQDHAG